MESFIKKLTITLVLATIVILLMGNGAESAILQHKRGISRREIMHGDFEQCRTNAVCGWEVYNPSTRAHQYYVSSSCKCHKNDTCIRVEDDINVPAYVYRCRDIRRRNNKTTTEPTAGAS